MLAFHRGRVALVREEYPTWGGAFWNVPSGAVEAHESPAQGAARELHEETGLVVDPGLLRLASTCTSRFADAESRAWNFTAETTAGEPRLEADDPDGLVQEVRWFAREEAVTVLGRLPYAPLREPALAYLRDGAVGREWVFVDGEVQADR